MIQTAENEVIRRAKASAAIRHWQNTLGFTQKKLADEVGLSKTAISNTLNHYHWYTISPEHAQKIIDVVAYAAASLIPALPMKVVAFCHETNFSLTEEKKADIITTVKEALVLSGISARQETATILPADVGGTLVQIGGDRSKLFLIALNGSDDDDDKRALVHELEHMKQMLLNDISKRLPHPPKSSF